MKNDYISRERLKNDFVGPDGKPLSGQRKVTIWHVRQVIDLIPKEDVVPVIRCEHCQSYDHGYCPTLKVRMDPCDYCSYGKRGTNAKT